MCISYFVSYTNFVMVQSILKLKNKSKFLSSKDLIVGKQSKYPSSWFFKPIGIEFEITGKCNLQCEGCAQQLDFPKLKDTLTTEQISSTIQSLSSIGAFAYSLTGGEAFLYLPRICEIISFLPEVDIYKLNTNGFRFTSKKASLDILKQLKKAGFGVVNKDILPVIVVSLGQQTKQGIPMENAVYLIQAFSELFGLDDALLSINVTDRNISDAMIIVKKFKALFYKMTGKKYDINHFPIRTFGLTNLTTLKRLGLASEKQDIYKNIISNFKNHYKSWKCLNLIPEGNDNLPTLTPRILIRPNGDVYACPGYNYVHKVGSLHEKNIIEILTDVNKNKVLSILFTEGLPGLLKKGKKSISNFDQQKISISATPCDVCQKISKQLYELEK